jgi:hypothetical protein
MPIEFLSRLIAHIEGDAIMSMEGDLSRCSFDKIEGYQTESSGPLKKITLWSTGRVRLMATRATWTFLQVPFPILHQMRPCENSWILRGKSITIVGAEATKEARPFTQAGGCARYGRENLAGLQKK